jgi:hypothetical protein
MLALSAKLYYLIIYKQFLRSAYVDISDSCLFNRAQAGETPPMYRKFILVLCLYIITHCPNKSEKSCMLSGLSRIRLKLTWPQCNKQLTMLNLRRNKYRTYLQLKNTKQIGVEVTLHICIWEVFGWNLGQDSG